jgi:hypothetical protein
MKIKKTHTFKDFVIDGIADTYNIKVKVDHWKLIIDVDGSKETYLLKEESHGISREQALEYIQQCFEMSIELELIK